MNRKVSVAPMMDCTDRHERYFLRLISKNTLLYTEMVVDEAINRGDKKKLLGLLLFRWGNRGQHPQSELHPLFFLAEKKYFFTKKITAKTTIIYANISCINLKFDR